MSLARSTLLVGAAALISRILGFARDVLIAGALGAGPAADAFLLAFRLPTFARKVLGEGGLNAGFVPVYEELKAREGAPAAARFAGEAFSGLALALLVLAALLELAAGLVVAALAAGEAGRLDDAELHLRLMTPFLVGATLASLAGAVLAAERRLLAAALAPLAVNLVLLVLLLVLQSRSDLDARARALWLSGGVGLSGVAQLLLLWPALRGLPVGLAWRLPRRGGPWRRLLAAGLPVLAAGSAAQLFLLAGAQAAAATPSAVSWLYYADRLIQLPLGLVAAAAGFVLLPEAAARHAAGDRAGLAAAQGRALESGLLLALPAAAALAILSRPIAAVLFERGAFTAADGAGTAAVLAALAPGLPFAVAGKVLPQAFFARGETRPALIALALGLAATWAGAGLLQARLGAPGAALGVTLGFVVHAGALALLLGEAGLWRPDRRLLGRTLRALGATGVMAAGLHALGPLAGSGVVGLVAACLAGLLLYVLAALGLGAASRADLALLKGR